MSEVINTIVSVKVKSDPETLVFTNDLADDLNIQILVGRNVIT